MPKYPCVAASTTQLYFLLQFLYVVLALINAFTHDKEPDLAEQTIAVKPSMVISVSYTHLTLPTN